MYLTFKKKQTKKKKQKSFFLFLCVSFWGFWYIKSTTNCPFFLLSVYNLVLSSIVFLSKLIIWGGKTLIFPFIKAAKRLPIQGFLFALLTNEKFGMKKATSILHKPERSGQVKHKLSFSFCFLACFGPSQCIAFSLCVEDGCFSLPLSLFSCGLKSVWYEKMSNYVLLVLFSS